VLAEEKSVIPQPSPPPPPPVVDDSKALVLVQSMYQYHTTVFVCLYI
jgi:hypothetical protein